MCIEATLVIFISLFLLGPLVVNNDVLVEKVRGIWFQSNKKLTEEVKEVIHSTFSDHPDPYSLLITHIERVGKTNIYIQLYILAKFIDLKVQ